MAQTNSESPTFVSYLIESGSGTSEVLVRRTTTNGMTIVQPIRQLEVSGPAGQETTMEKVVAAVELDEWARQHREVFTEGRTVSQD